MIDEYFLKRHTVRSYSSRSVSEELLNEILAAAIHAPNTGNMQLYSIVVTSDRSTLQQLHAAHFNQPAAVNAPVILTFCVDVHRFEQWCGQRQAEAGFRNLQSFLWATIDATAVAQQFVTIAELQGLGSCYLGTTTYNAPLIAEVLSLPNGVVPLVSLSVGYPLDSEPSGATERLPLEAVIHKDKYKEYTPADIDRLYAPKEALPENVEFVKENDKQTLAQVFAEVRYPKRDNETFSRSFGEFLEDQGFKFPAP